MFKVLKRGAGAKVTHAEDLVRFPALTLGGLQQPVTSALGDCDTLFWPLQVLNVSSFR